MVNYEEYRTSYAKIVEDLTGRKFDERKAFEIFDKILRAVPDFVWDCGNIYSFEELIRYLFDRPDLDSVMYGFYDRRFDLERDERGVILVRPDDLRNLYVYVVDDYEVVEDPKAYGLYHDHVIVIPTIHFDRVSEIAKEIIKSLEE